MTEDERAQPVLVTLAGKLDYSREIELRRRIGQALASCAGRHVAVDLAEVTAIDPNAIASLLYCRERARRFGTELVLINASPPVAEALRRGAAANLLGGGGLSPVGEKTQGAASPGGYALKPAARR